MSWYDLDSNEAQVCTNKAQIYSIKQGLSWFAKGFSYYCSKYGLLRPCTIKHDFYSINWTFTGSTYGPTDFSLSSIPYDLYRILTRLSSLLEWTLCAVVYTISYGLTRSCTVSHILIRSLIRLYTDMAPVSVF